MSLAGALLITTALAVGAAGATPRLAVAPGQCSGPAAAAAADALATAFDTHQFVFIGSTHGDLKIEEFLMCLVSRPSFTRRVTDIIVEWASSGQQRLLDRYILSLDALPMEALAPVWFDTDAPTMWTTLPQVRRFMETLREANRGLAPAQRMRLVGGNDGTDWTNVRVVEDLAPYPYKTNLLPHLLIEHLAKTPGNRTLVVYGDAHIRYQGNNFMGDLEAALGRRKLFVVGRIGQLVPEERPYLAALGNPKEPFFVKADRFPANPPWPNSLRVAGNERSARLADYIDAFVYLGPEPDTDLVGAIPLTPEQQRELARRNLIMSDPQRTMNVRYGGRAQWFRAHPNDLPPRPQTPARAD
jgi:hypothetical protein